MVERVAVLAEKGVPAQTLGEGHYYASSGMVVKSSFRGRLSGGACHRNDGYRWRHKQHEARATR